MTKAKHTKPQPHELVDLVAVGSACCHAGRQLQAGEAFTARRADARVLVAINRAALAPVETEADKEAAVKAKAEADKQAAETKQASEAKQEASDKAAADKAALATKAIESKPDAEQAAKPATKAGATYQTRDMVAGGAPSAAQAAAARAKPTKAD